VRIGSSRRRSYGVAVAKSRSVTPSGGPGRTLDGAACNYLCARKIGLTRKSGAVPQSRERKTSVQKNPRWDKSAPGLIFHRDRQKKRPPGEVPSGRRVFQHSGVDQSSSLSRMVACIGKRGRLIFPTTFSFGLALRCFAAADFHAAARFLSFVATSSTSM